MFGAILKATNSSFQKGMTFCRSIYVKKVMKLLAFIFEQPSYFILIYIPIQPRKSMQIVEQDVSINTNKHTKSSGTVVKFCRQHGPVPYQGFNDRKHGI